MTAARRVLALWAVAALAVSTLAQVDDEEECIESATAFCSDLDSSLESGFRTSADVTVREDCEICGEPTVQRASMDACCANSPTSTEECRNIVLNVPTSDRPGEGEALTEDDLLTIPLEMSAATTAERSCVRTCQAYGDPEMFSTCGKYREMILCDGRVDGTPDQRRILSGSTDFCGQSQSVCESRVDHEGNACKWLPATGEWDSFERDGSQCQVDLGVSSAPTQLLYSRAPLDGESGPSFSVLATIGDRGVITSLSLTINGDTTIIDARTCVLDQDASNAATLFDRPGVADRLNPVHNALNSKQTRVTVTWSPNGEPLVDVSFVCQAMNFELQGADATRFRIDADNIAILDTSAQAALSSHESGFCIDSQVNLGQATVSSVPNLHALCLNEHSPNNAACRTLVSLECTLRSYEPFVEQWCQDVAGLGDVPANPAQCASRLNAELAKEAASKSSNDLWPKWYCSILSGAGVSTAAACREKIRDFGIAETVMELGNTPANTGVQCNLDADLTPVTDDECFNGVHIKVDMPNGQREIIASVPMERLVCGADKPLVLNGKDHGAAFMYQTYISQCGLTDTCNRVRGYTPVPAVEIPADSQLTMTLSSNVGVQEICTDEAAPTVSSCPTQCCADYLDGAPQCLEVTLSDSAYCSGPPSQNNGVNCNDIPSSDAKVTITLNLLEEGPDAPATCCRTSLGWGDPLLLAFNKESPDDVVKWLQCDGRNPACNFNEETCVGQRDHLDNACVWNQDVQDQLNGQRFNVDFYGSPCQVDWAKSAEFGWLPNVTMFENEFYRVRVFLGERSVLTDLQFEVLDGRTYTFDPSNAFVDLDDSAALDAWSANPSQDGFAVTCETDFPAPGNPLDFVERGCVITHADTDSFVQWRVIRGEVEGDFAGARINIQSVTEHEPYFEGAGGFAVTNDITDAKGASTRNAVAERNCGLDGEEGGSQRPLLRVAKNIWHETATINEARDFAVRDWCLNAAVLDFNRKLNCVDNILGDGTKTDDEIANAWISTFCRQFPDANYMACKTGNTYNAAFFRNRVPTANMCFTTLEELESIPANPCALGVKVLALADNQGNDEEEIMFIPDDIPPCTGSITVPANSANSKYAMLFTRSIEFRKCGVSAELCPMEKNLAARFCRPVYAYSVTMDFDDGSICP